MLALEYLEKKRPIKSVDIHPGNTMDDLKVEMTISEKDFGYFDVAHWDFTGSKKKSNGQTVSLPLGTKRNFEYQKIGMISSPQAPVTGIREFFRANYLTICATIVWMFCVISFFCCLIPFVIFISFIMAIPCAIYDCIIAPFLSLPLIPPPGPQPDIYVLLRRNEQYSQSVVTKRSELARNRLRMRLSLCSGIQVLRIKGIYLWTFDTLCHCLPLVNIGRMEIELASFNDHPDLNNPIYRRAFEYVWLLSGVFLGLQILLQRFNQRTGAETQRH